MIEHMSGLLAADCLLTRKVYPQQGFSPVIPSCTFYRWHVGSDTSHISRR